MTRVICSFLYVSLVAIILFLPRLSHGNGCIDCHSDPDFFVQDRKLYSYYQDYIKSPHSEAGLTCDYCHGGNAQAADQESAHKEIPQLTDTASKLYYKNLPETCGSCHTDKLAQFKQSKHYKALMSDKLAPSCATCHSPMNPRPDYREIIDKSCRNCHNEKNAPQIPLVADRADDVLHRLSIAKVYLGWTAVYYASMDWPGDSQQQVDDISREYSAAVSRVHSFDLCKMDESSDQILTKLTDIFENAWKEKNIQE